MKSAEEIAIEVVRIYEHQPPSIAGRAIVDLVSGAITEAFKIGFEHAVSSGQEASRRIPALADKMPLVMVLYFATETDRQAIIDAVTSHKPGIMVEVKVTERD